MGAALKLTGKKFGHLTVIRLSTKKIGNLFWLCKCDCGKEAIVNGYKLKAGHTSSCGHLKWKWNVSHRLSKTNLYHVWYNMISRCYNPSNKNYKDYGERGIYVCASWKKDITVFYKWAMRNGYKKGLMLDRENNNGIYKPSNCRFVTNKVSANNMRNNVYLTFNNETHTKTEWSKIFGVCVGSIEYRMERGWDIDKIFTTPFKRNNKKIK